MRVDWANSRVPLRALETVLYSLLVIIFVIDWEKLASFAGTVFSTSARSTMDRVVCWPRHCLLHWLTKSSQIFWPMSSVDREVSLPRALSQLV